MKASNFVEKLSLFYIFALTSPLLGDTHGTPGKFACSHESFVANNLREEGGDTDGDELAILTNREDVPVTCEGDKEIHTLTGPRCTSEEIDSKISDVEVPKSVTCAFMDNKFIRAVVFLDGQPVVETTEGSSVVVDGETRKRKYCKRKNRKGQDLDGQLKNQDT